MRRNGFGALTVLRTEKLVLRGGPAVGRSCHGKCLPSRAEPHKALFPVRCIRVENSNSQVSTIAAPCRDGQYAGKCAADKRRRRRPFRAGLTLTLFEYD